MKVALVTGGFPDSSNSLKGIFNKKAAIEIAKYVNLTVIHFRMLKLGRKYIERTEENGYKLIRIAIPQIPIFNKYTICINTYLMQIFLKPHIKKYELIHSVSGLVGIAIGRFKKKLVFKHICQIIGSDINDILPNLKKIRCIKKIEGIDRIVCNSESLKDQIKNVFGITKNVFVVFRGVDLKRFSSIEKNLEKEVVFLFLGGLANYKHTKFGTNLKGGISLMEAWGIVDKNISNKASIKLLFGGPNTFKNKSLSAWKKKLNHEGKVEILGQVDPSNILKIFNSSNVTIIPSMSEGFPNVGMESFASGNCVIGSDVGGLPELIDENINGLIFENGNKNQLAKKIEKLFDKDIVNKLGENAKNKAINKFDSNNFGKEYLKIYLSK